jgi:hypothetical protein
VPKGWRTRSSVPPAALAGVELLADEHPLTAARLLDGSYAVATDRRLLIPEAGGTRGIRWEQIAVATWGEGVLNVRETGGSDGPGRTHILRLGDEVELPQTVRERVQASIVISEHVALIGRKGALISGRRAPGSDAVSWTVTFDPGLDPHDPRLRAAADEQVERFRQLVQ